ncbi:protein-L-isoaspartate O-methyltransferase [Actinomycetaceae bacterium L2_0104]
MSDTAASPLHDRVREAMNQVPRADFLPDEVKHLASYDGPLPIGESQTNSQPYTVEVMLQLLDVQPGQRVLDVGAGSGWTTAVLAHLVGKAGKVFGVERHAKLIEPARRALAKHNAGQAEIGLAQTGVLGLSREGPFDRILVSAQAWRIPDQLTEQLADGGIMVIPVSGVMRRVVRRGGNLDVSDHGLFRFVPLIED